MLQLRPVSASQFVERFRTAAGRRTLGLGVALLIEALIILLLLTLGRESHPGVKEDLPTVITFIAPEAAEKAPQPSQPEQHRQAQQRPETPQQPTPDRPTPPQPAQPAPPSPTPPVPVAPAIIPMRWSLAPSGPHAPPAPPARALYGPADNRSPAMRDTERVGTAPNGEPLYAAEWYREPDHHMLGTYLSTANGPGWGLIACRTAPEYRVEDCVGLGEYPEGSNIARSVLAAAWEFRVRPPRRGGQPLVGSWVRIRIDYDFNRH